MIEKFLIVKQYISLCLRHCKDNKSFRNRQILRYKNIKPPVAGTAHGPNTFFLILKEMGLKDKDVPIEE